MASMLTIAPDNSSRSSSFGIAVISLDFVSTATCPNVRPCWVAQADQMQRVTTILGPAGTTQRLPVDRNEMRLTPPSTRGGAGKRRDPVQKRHLKLLRLNERDDASDGVVRRDAVGARETNLRHQARFWLAKSSMSLGPSCAPNRRRNANEEDIHQLMVLGPIDSGIMDTGKKWHWKSNA